MDDTTQSSIENTGSRNGIIIAMVVVLLLLGVGVYYVLGKSSNSTQNIAKDTSLVTPTPEDAFSSLQDALARSLSLRCDYTDEMGKKTIAYIKSGSVRADISGPISNSSVILKEKKMYFWTGKQGFIMTFDMGDMMHATTAARLSGMPSGVPTPPGQPAGPLGAMQDIEKYKKYCKVATVDDKLFVLPTDVSFTDMSKMMPNGMTMPGVPAMPSGMNPEQMKMMQQQMKSAQPTITP